jgi:phage shock protein E
MSLFGNLFHKHDDGSNIDVHQFEDLMKDKNNLILDVRTPQEFNDARIKGSINIDYYKSDFMDKIGKLDKEKTILIYCRSGNRSYHAMQKMKKMGFKNPLNLKGGIISWTSSNKPIV